MSTHARQLAEWLAGRGYDDLARLLVLREVSPEVRWNDFFDAAESLLDPASVSRALQRLPRAEAAVLCGVEQDADAAAALRARALRGEDDTPYPPVAAALIGRDVPGSPDDSPPAPADDASSAHAAERAFTHVAAIADVLMAVRESPLALLTDGTVGASARRRFAEDDALSDANLDDLVVSAVDARLAVIEERTLRITERGDRWLLQGVADRWAVLAEGFRDRLPRGLRSETGGWIAASAWPDAFPWDGSWPAVHESVRRRALMLGLLASGDTEPAWAVALRRGEPADASALMRMLPAEVDRIFLQNDLSAISPGPLAPALDVRLRTVARRESASQAASYRFTAETVSHALALGETEQSLLAFLGELSLTGIPQPLEYLIAQTAARHGLVRVSTDVSSGHTRVRSTDEHLLDAMAVDQTLRPLGLTRADEELRSRVNATTVFWALSDARYPATLVNAWDEPIVAGRHPSAPMPEDRSDAADYAPLIERLRSQHGPDADAAWLERALESAVQDRALLRVEVAMPDGTTRELMLEATGLGGGRLRGLDRAADVERTLPVRSIRSATLVEG